VHGYTQNRANFLGIARALEAAKIAPLFGFNYPWTARVEGNARRLAQFVERVARETGRPHVSLVAHSMGGLVCLEYMHTTEGAARVRKCVTIASPHAGIAWRGPVIGASGAQLRAAGEYLRDRKGRKIVVPTLSIYSTHANLVHPPATSALAARGGFDHAVGELGHLSILFDAAVASEVVRFLAAGAAEYAPEQSAIRAE
jgi:triacylglycerol lipase